MKLASAIMTAGTPMLYYPSLAKVVGGVGPAVLFCALVWRDVDFDHERSTDKLIITRKSVAALEAETGLSEKELRGARQKLERLGIVKSRYRRMKHSLDFEVNIERADALCTVVNAPAKRADAGISQKGGCSPGAPAKRADGHLPKGQIDPYREKSTKNENKEQEPATAQSRPPVVLCTLPFNRPLKPSNYKTTPRNASHPLADAGCADSDKAKAAWLAIANHLKGETNIQAWETWIKPLRGYSVCGDTLRVSIPTGEFAAWIRENWLNKIEGAVSKLGLPYAAIEFYQPIGEISGWLREIRELRGLGKIPFVAASARAVAAGGAL
jgi:hypothetical protein